MTAVLNSCAHPLILIICLPRNLPGNFPDLPGLRVFDAPGNGARNGPEKRYWNHGFSNMVSRLEKWPPGPETSFVTSCVATFDHEIETWSGLGTSGAGDTDGNGTNRDLQCSHLFPFLFPDTSRIFPDCGFFDSRFLPSRFSSRKLPGSSRIAVI